MSFSANARGGISASKENDPPSSKTAVSQFQRPKQRTVLGVLSENEQFCRPLSQGSQFSCHSSASDGSQFAYFGSASSSSFDVYVEEPCEVVFTAPGEEAVSDSHHLQDESNALRNEEDARLLLELSSSACHDAAAQPELNESLTLEEALCVSEYANDIYWHTRETEIELRPKTGYLENHPGITNDMRVILVDWMVEVVQEFGLCCETLHLAVNYTDRFLSGTICVRRSKLQLVGTAALFIAAKYEEILPPELDDFVYITDTTYTRKQLIQMEHVFLDTLVFRMAAPTTQHFLRQFMLVHSVNATTENLALYVAELSLLEMEPFLQYTPSTVAAAAYCLANYTVNKALWPESLQTFSGYTMAEIVECLTDLHKLYKNAESFPQQAIREKYKSSQYCRVSLITAPAILPLQ